MSELRNRLSIWKALSEFYLDTELQDDDYNSIYKALVGSGKSLDELKEIDLYEVFPTLQKNLYSVAGEWAGFDEKWLEAECTKNYKKKNNFLFRLKIKILSVSKKTLPITQFSSSSRRRGSHGLRVGRSPVKLRMTKKGVFLLTLLNRSSFWMRKKHWIEIGKKYKKC